MSSRKVTSALLFLSCAVALSGVLCRPAAGQARRPNIVFIITDDQRWDSLGVTGHRFARTPNVDRLAREGALFTNFFATTPLCSPSRVSFLTGQYAHAHKVTNNGRVGLDVISHTLMTFPRRLREAGYETAFIGKGHMGLRGVAACAEAERAARQHRHRLHERPRLSARGARPVRQQAFRV
jgi:arylsulfatase A-like enzyme